MTDHKTNHYLELPARDLEKTKTFFYNGVWLVVSGFWTRVFSLLQPWWQWRFLSVRALLESRSRCGTGSAVQR